MRWDFETQGTKEQAKKDVDKVHKGEEKGAPPGLPDVVATALKTMIDEVNVKPAGKDDPKNYSVSVKSDGQSDDTFVTARLQVSRIVVG